MKKFVTGDTHGNEDRNKLKKFHNNKLLGYTLNKDDILYILGDWGVLWYGEYAPPEKLQEQRLLLEWYGQFPCRVLFIDGNHENHTLLDSLPTEERWGGIVGKVADNIWHLKRGYVYEIEGDKIFTFGGALSTDQDYRIPGVSWWDRELPNKEEFDRAQKNLEKNNWKVDYVMTHTGPRSILSQMGFKITSSRVNDPTTVFLDTLKSRLTFDQWFFGHMHIDSFPGNNLEFVALYNSVFEIGSKPEEED